MILSGLLLTLAASAQVENVRDDPLLRAGIERCEAIPKKKGQTFMIFNPKKHRTVYYRSSCFQGLAINHRQVSLCDHVIERKSWFFDGSGVSPEACVSAVALKAREDREAAAKIDAGQIIKIASAALKQNGNGRDYDLNVEFTGTEYNQYRLSAFVIDDTDKKIKIFEKIHSYSETSLSRHFFIERSAFDQLPDHLKHRTAHKIELEMQLIPAPSRRHIYKHLPAPALNSRLVINADLSGG